jgi:hypothetical protein
MPFTLTQSDMNGIGKLKVVELKQLMEQHDLPVKGKKDALFDRLAKHLQHECTDNRGCSIYAVLNNSDAEAEYNNSNEEENAQQSEESADSDSPTPLSGTQHSIDDDFDSRDGTSATGASILHVEVGDMDAGQVRV